MEDRQTEARSWGQAGAGRKFRTSVKHHPSSQLLADCAMADVSPGVALAVSAHVALCPRCRMTAPAGGEDGGSGAEPLEVFVEAGGEALPALRLEPWTPQTSGVATALAPHANGLGECVYLLRATPGADIAPATLRTAFLLLVLAGAVLLEGRRLGAGDLVELDAETSSASADPVNGATLLVVADEAPRPRSGRR